MSTRREKKSGSDLVDEILGLITDVDDIKLSKCWEIVMGAKVVSINSKTDTFTVEFNVEEKPIREETGKV